MPQTQLPRIGGVGGAPELTATRPILLDGDDLGRRYNELIVASDYAGVAADGNDGGTGTDNATGMQAAIDAAEAAGAPLYVNEPGRYYFGSGVTCETSLLCAPGVIWETDQNITLLTLGSDSTNLHNKKFILPDLNQITRVWSETGGTGTVGTDVAVHFKRLVECEVHVGQVNDFSTALLAKPTGGGFAYNRVYARYLLDNAVGCHLVPGVGGWTNQNKLQLDRVTLSTGPTAGTTNLHYLKIEVVAGEFNPNGNWVWGSFEGTVPEFQLSISGRENVVMGRLETTGAARIEFPSLDATDRAIYNHVILWGDGIVQATQGTDSTMNRVDSPWQHQMYMTGAGDPMWAMSNSGSSANPIIATYAAGTDPQDSATDLNDWVTAIQGDGIRVKAPADTPANAPIYLRSTGQAEVKYLTVEDGVTTPGTVSGSAHVYVDTADGKLKSKYGDGTVRTLRSGAAAQVYTPTNVTTTRTYDADASSVAELADVLGTLIADLQAEGVIG